MGFADSGPHLVLSATQSDRRYISWIRSERFGMVWLYTVLGTWKGNKVNLDARRLKIYRIESLPSILLFDDYCMYRVPEQFPLFDAHPKFLSLIAKNEGSKTVS